MLRLFTGIELPADIRMRLSLLSGEIDGAKWVEPDDLHLTLRFLGDIDRRTANEVFDTIARDMAQEQFASFELTLEGLAAFGGTKPTAVWIGAEPKAPLARLNQLHERAARSAGLDADARAFTPHVTLARLRGARAAPVAGWIQSHGRVVTRPFEVTRIAVFSARAGGGGPYAVEETIDLG